MITCAKCRRTDALLDDWQALRRAGVSREDAAPRLGVTLAALERALERHRDDPRARPGTRRHGLGGQPRDGLGRWVA